MSVNTYTWAFFSEIAEILLKNHEELGVRKDFVSKLLICKHIFKKA